ncbi:MAG TPA: hypothetical protein VE956_21905 [Nodularia sp. (in: cyanobacteria)]|nr:hypothetical protein [Nodularia sp. (in: cyanobacteria)]
MQKWQNFAADYFSHWEKLLSRQDDTIIATAVTDMVLVKTAKLKLYSANLSFNKGLMLSSRAGAIADLFLGFCPT